MLVILLGEGRWLWGNGAVAEGKVDDGGENISQLIGKCSEIPPRDVVWSICLL